MYGLVNRAIESLIRDRFGRTRWDAIKARAHIDLPSFVGMEAYPDSVTYGLVAAASQELQIPAGALLEAFGEYWTLYTAQEGYGDLLAIGGRTFIEFIQNLDRLHAHVGLSFPDLHPPSFWCTDLTPHSLTFHYRSEREGLAPMVIGLVRGLGRRFGTEVTIVHTARRGDGVDHDVFNITYKPVV